MNKYKRLLLAVCVIGFSLLLLVSWAQMQRRAKLGPGGTRQGDSSTAFELARSAMAATEALDTEPADRDWSALFEQMPNDKSVAVNRALNRLLRVDSLTEATTNATLSAEEKQEARRQLPGAIQQARVAVDDYEKISQDDLTCLWLRGRVNLQEASLLPASLGKSIRIKEFGSLAAAIDGPLGASPGASILGGLLVRALDELETATSGLPGELVQPAAAAIGALSDKQTDNLFIALRAAKSRLAAHQQNASETIERTKHLASAIEPSIRPATESIGMTPDELVQKIQSAVDEQDWQSAENLMNLWFNVLNSTDLVKTDRRRSSPHPLDRLSFEILRTLAGPLAQDNPIAAGGAGIHFEKVPFATTADVVAVLPVDFDLDLDPDVATVTASGALAIWKNDQASGWPNFATTELAMACRGLLAVDLFMVDASDPRRLQAVASPATTTDGAIAGSSARHNTLPTLVVFGDGGVKLLSIDSRPSATEDNRLAIVSGITGLEDVSSVTAAVTGDLEGDGDLDLVFATSDRGLRIFVNRGNRTFFEPPLTNQSSDLAKGTSIVAMAIADLDRDLDLDVVTLDGKTGRVGLIDNQLHLQFRLRELTDVGAVAGAAQVRVEDIDGNVSWDVVVVGYEQVQVAYSQTADTGVWTVEQTKVFPYRGGAVLLGDLDNDSWFEIMSGDALQRLAGKMVATLAADAPLVEGIPTALADFDLDGKNDVLTLSEGNCLEYRNTTPATGHYVDVRFRGIDDNNANSGRVNHYAIGSVVELRFGPHYRAQIITTPTTHFGLDGFDDASSLRVIFPNGLTQTIREPSVDLMVEEEQTLKGSCPYLYAWDGTRFRFATDCLWAAPLGLQVASGVVAKDRPWEYLKVDGKHVQPRDGHYEFRITEELWEAAYFDHVSLVAVDHPANVEVWTNEKVGPAEIAEPTIYAFADADRISLAHGVDTSGNDVTSDLSQIDKQYVQGFDRRLRQGLCPPHWVDLQFNATSTKANAKAKTYLVMTGWILPTDTSLNIQIDQNPELPSIEFPSIWVPDASEAAGWRKAIPFMGFPGGKTKTIVVDVSDVLDRNDPRLRVRTSAQIYWDAAHLVVQNETPDLIVHKLELADAELAYHGFSQRVVSSPKSPENFLYDKAMTTPKWPPMQGRFTRFGDCLALVTSWDDSMVVMGAGDEMRLRFVVPKQLPLPGWTRDFVLHCVGWDKDADLNTLAGQSSEPMPFRSMRQYPPLVDQRDESRRIGEMNSVHQTRTQSYRDFWQRN